jgi:hypothetical protein
MEVEDLSEYLKMSEYLKNRPNITMEGKIIEDSRGLALAKALKKTPL